MPSILIIDGYIDEPASLGVPPYISPLVRATYGAAKDAGSDVSAITIDAIRKGGAVPKADFTVILGGCAVPGRYIRGMPASTREVEQIAQISAGTRVLGGPAVLSDDKRLEGLFDVVARRDPAAALFDLIETGRATDRWRTLSEWNGWLLKGAESVSGHPDFPQPLIAEVETYRGCVRYKGGGCSFCIEPLKGKPLHREPRDIIEEVTALHGLGVVNFRLGAQTCFMSYKSFDEGSETPTPNPEAIEELLSGIAALDVDVLHLDNANPAVIASHPQESRMIVESIMRHCTSGNVLALGMESADPAVIEANNLNSTPDQVMESVRLLNELGRERGPNGMPKLLPGVNFIVGLDGERKDTLRLNLDFLRSVKNGGLLLRRINIRQVMPLRREFKGGVGHSDFIRFKEAVREEIDRPMLNEMLPQGTILTRVYTELREGNRTFGRQIGSYPLLVGFEYPLPIGEFVDATIVDWGLRSVTAVESPLRVNSCPLAALSSLPSIGKKRAMRILRRRPFKDLRGFAAALDEPSLADGINELISFD
ncbi:MAG: radical SAM protein [Methanomassiliicoccales archaeon]|jgi:radical SAM superfamily enzyme with C-terminal helix-hairpin-helix motif